MQNFILGQRNFWSKDEILTVVKNSESFDPQQEDLDNAESLLIFTSSKQQTWLITTAARLYCVLDDIRKTRPELQWILTQGELISEGEITATVRTKDKSERTGLLDVGPRRNWLFSKTLFVDEPLEKRLITTLRDTMISPSDDRDREGSA